LSEKIKEVRGFNKLFYIQNYKSLTTIFHLFMKVKNYIFPVSGIFKYESSFISVYLVYMVFFIDPQPAVISNRICSKDNKI